MFPTIHTVRLDKHKVFEHPVDATLVSDYYDIVKNPMDFATVVSKIEGYEYHTLEAFQVRMSLKLNNLDLYLFRRTSSSFCTMHSCTTSPILSTPDSPFVFAKPATTLSSPTLSDL